MMPLQTAPVRTRSPLRFFVLVFALSIPFWLAGGVTSLQLLPGLPVSALEFICPGLAALILTYRESRGRGVKALLMRSFDYGRIKGKLWYAPILLLMPGITLLSYGLLRFVGVPLPMPGFPVLRALALLLVFFVAALGEELGWSGYITDPMQERRGALSAGILLGMVWALWHVVPLTQAGRSAAWIAWWCLFSVAQRVLIVWLFNHTGKSVFAAALCHATGNLSWVLFPNYDSAWDPRIAGLVATFAALMIVVVWGPRISVRTIGS
jgi:membrane protease YdiL (CAAX protease family)